MKLMLKTLQYLYFHSTGASNIGSAVVTTNNRTYVVDLAQASTPQSVQMQQNETILRVDATVKGAAAGKLEVSKVSASQIGTSPPTQDVLARFDIEPVTTSGLPAQVFTWAPGG
jgi:type IV secretory pathway VirB9-like protein